MAAPGRLRAGAARAPRRGEVPATRGQRTRGHRATAWNWVIGCSGATTGESESSASMATDTVGVDRALGAIGTTFRLTRLYPPTHPAVQEALRQIGEALPPLAALGTVEWKIAATGLHRPGPHLVAPKHEIPSHRALL